MKLAKIAVRKRFIKPSSGSILNKRFIISFVYIVVTNLKETLKKMWHTDCEFCRKSRMLILWLILMLIADALWFHLLIN